VGVLHTIMPRSVAAATSMLSKPAPARTRQRQRVNCAIERRVSNGRIDCTMMTSASRATASISSSVRQRCCTQRAPTAASRSCSNPIGQNSSDQSTRATWGRSSVAIKHHLDL